MLILHVGPHKTATTWIQSNLHHNAGRLEQAGWYYPATGERVVIAHHDLSDNPKEINDPASRKHAEFTRIAARAQERGLNIILSSEGFRNWRPRQIRQLQAIMAGHELRIVYCLRDPVSLLYSFWAQQVKTGMSHSLPEFVARQQQMTTKVNLLDPQAEISRFAEIESAKLALLNYDEIRRSDRDIFDVFCSEFLGLTGLPHVEANSVNQREPLELTEFMRLVLKRSEGWRRQDDQIKIGVLFRFMLSEARKRHIIETIAAVPAARRSLRVDRNGDALQRVEANLVRLYGEFMVPPPGANGLFLREAANFDYLDEAALCASPAVNALLDETVATLGPGSVRMRIVSALRSGMIAGRRVLKKFR